MFRTDGDRFLFLLESEAELAEFFEHFEPEYLTRARFTRMMTIA